MTKETLVSLKDFIRDVPDFPKKGIVFRDVTPLLQDPAIFSQAVSLLAGPIKRMEISHVVAVESRGFIFGAPIASALNAGFVPVRKKGKLPWNTVTASYQLEYGTDTLEMHIDALPANARALIIDDVLATGGTAKATCELVEKLKGKVVALSFLIELTALKGRQLLQGRNVFSVIQY